MDEFLTQFLTYLGIVMGISLVISLFLLLIIWRRLQRIEVPPGAGFSETMRYTPLLVVVTIDLLDLGLDVLAAPVAWVVLDRLGLKALRGVSAVEALIPFTQPIPTLTLSWVAVRYFGLEIGEAAAGPKIINGKQVE